LQRQEKDTVGRIVTTLVLVVAGAVWYAIAGEDPQIASCVRQVDKVAAAYRSHPPKAESHKAIESTLKHSRTWCGDKKFKDANNGIEMAAFLCVASKGCKPLLDEARRQKQSSR
jgi:hypothetical protein